MPPPVFVHLRLHSEYSIADGMVRLDEAVARAMGDLGEPGPVYLEIPTDVLRTHVRPQLVLDGLGRALP